MKKLNLGCGNDIREGWINLDKFHHEGVDVVHNLEEFPYPFKDNEFDFILLDGVIEHLYNTLGVMSEIHRILKSGGRVRIIFPYYNSPLAWTDPTHVKCLTWNAFYRLSKNHLKERKKHRGRYESLPCNKDKMFSGFKYKYNPTWLGYMVYPFIKWLRHFCSILILDVEVEMVK